MRGRVISHGNQDQQDKRDRRLDHHKPGSTEQAHKRRAQRVGKQEMAGHEDNHNNQQRNKFNRHFLLSPVQLTPPPQDRNVNLSLSGLTASPC